MHTVGIKTLKDRLSEYIRVAAAGETVLVTDRGRIVAEIIAPRVPPDASLPEQKMGELKRQGLVKAARIRLEGPVRHLPTMTVDELMSDIDADRSDR